jgi:hypothetical protein
MQRKAVQQLTILATAGAMLLFAADPWKTKDSKEWTSEEVTKVLTASPWAKDLTVAPEGAQPQQRMGRRGGGMGGGGIGGYPGGGGGYGYPGGGGGGYPNGGGGGYPNGGGGGYPNDGGRPSSMNLTIRWQSAQPVQEALAKQRSLTADEAKSLADVSQKDYVITVIGFRTPSRRNRNGDIDSSDSNDQDRDTNTKSRTDALRSRFIDAARLVPKGKSPVYAEDVQFEGPNGASEMRFLFPRSKEISADDKEVVFSFESQGIKFEHKFRLSDMNYQGKLAL